MRIIKDTNGGDWELDLTIGAAEPLEAFLRERYQVELFNVLQALTAFANPITAINCLAVLTRRQRADRGVSSEDFGRLFKGGCAYDAMRALLEEYKDFFPDPAQKKILESNLKRILFLNESGKRIVESAMQKTLNEIEATQRAMTSELGLKGDFWNSQESQELEPITSD